MLTYQLADFVYEVEKPQAFQFPCDVVVHVALKPAAAFGGRGDRAVTVVGQGKVTVSRRTGWVEFHPEPAAFIRPLSTRCEDWNAEVVVDANVVTYSFRCPRRAVLTSWMDYLQNLLPLAVHLKFAGTPAIERIYGSVGGVGFDWVPAGLSGQLDVVPTQEVFAKRFEDVIRTMHLIGPEHNRRLYVALSYLYKADRLLTAGAHKGEFASEALLNYCKCLQALFGSARDRVREALASLSYSDVEVEADFMPAMILRDEIDVGHVSYALYSREQIGALSAYVSRAHAKFRPLLQRVAQDVADEKLVLDPGGSFEVDTRKATTLAKLHSTVPRGRKPARHGTIYQRVASSEASLDHDR